MYFLITFSHKTFSWLLVSPSCGAKQTSESVNQVFLVMQQENYRTLVSLTKLIT